MVPWGQNPNSTESRDLTHVLLSPRMGDDAKSPLNRKMPNLKNCGDLKACPVINLFRGDACLAEDAGDTGNGGFHKPASCKTLRVEQSRIFSDLYNSFLHLAELLAGLARQLSTQKKKGSKHSAFYIFAGLAFMFLLIKVSSFGWFAAQTLSSSSKVSTFILLFGSHLIRPPRALSVSTLNSWVLILRSILRAESMCGFFPAGTR